MDTSTALIVGLWVAGLTWFARQLKGYFKEKSQPAAKKKRVEAAKTPLTLPDADSTDPEADDRAAMAAENRGTPGQAKPILRRQTARASQRSCTNGRHCRTANQTSGELARTTTQEGTGQQNKKTKTMKRLIECVPNFSEAAMPQGGRDC